MKKQYETPALEVESLTLVDVILASRTEDIGGGGFDGTSSDPSGDFEEGGW